MRNKVYISLIESDHEEKINAYYKHEFNQKTELKNDISRNYNVAIDNKQVLIQSDVSMNTNLDVSQNVHFGLKKHPVTFNTGAMDTKIIMAV